jgi:putative component of membrane protein insertase Oxa1/YidC/SpoIIIJ protein YidD
LAVIKPTIIIAGVIISTCLAGQTGAENENSSRSKVSTDTISSQSFSEDNNAESPNEVRLVFVAGIRLYQILLSSQDKPRCSFFPSCSHFGQEAISEYGLQGLLMTSDRLQRCNGMSADHYRINPETGLIDDPADKYVLWSDEQAYSSAVSTGTTLGMLLAYDQQPDLRGRVDKTRIDSNHDQVDDGRGFADYLFAKGEYKRAAAEYQRYLFTTEISESTADTVQLQIGICFRHAKDPAAAAPYFRSVYERLGSTGIGCAAQRQLIYVKWDQGRNEEALELISTLDYSADTAIKRCLDNTQLGITYLLKMQWDTAHDALDQVEESRYAPETSFIGELKNVATDGMNLAPKSPTTAALMSAVIPGSGKVWLGRTWDGLFSCLSVALTAWVAVEGFQDGGGNSVQGWVFGFLTAGFYAGNIYGSAVTARNINRDAEHQVWTKASQLAFEFSFRL